MNVILGVTGGIAAYKSAELVRLLKQHSHEVQVVMTASAASFITPLTFQALSGRPVRMALFDEAAEAAMSHIELARWADLLLVAPASADIIAKFANGLADDLLSTLYLAYDGSTVLAPAMNRVMWHHPAVQRNIEVLISRGVGMLGPAEGDQACGEVGLGRMLEPQAIVAELLDYES